MFVGGWSRNSKARERDLNAIYFPKHVNDIFKFCVLATIKPLLPFTYTPFPSNFPIY